MKRIKMIIIKKSSFADRVFAKVFFLFNNSDKYKGAEWSTKAL